MEASLETIEIFGDQYALDLSANSTIIRFELEIKTNDASEKLVDLRNKISGPTSMFGPLISK